MAAPYAAAFAELAQVLGEEDTTRHHRELFELLRQTDGKVDVVINRYFDLVSTWPAAPPAAPTLAAPLPAPAPAPATPAASRAAMEVDARAPSSVSPPLFRGRPLPASSVSAAAAPRQPSVSPPSTLSASTPAARLPRPSTGTGPELARSDSATGGAWPKLLGDTMVKAYAMVSGRDKLVPGDTVVLDRVQASAASTPTPGGGRTPSSGVGGSGGSSTPGPGGVRFAGKGRPKSDNIIVRLLVRGREVGKLASETARYVAKVCASLPSALVPVPPCGPLKTCVRPMRDPRS